jgi:hypothetical protein
VLMSRGGSRETWRHALWKSRFKMGRGYDQHDAARAARRRQSFCSRANESCAHDSEHTRETNDQDRQIAVEYWRKREIDLKTQIDEERNQERTRGEEGRLIALIAERQMYLLLISAAFEEDLKDKVAAKEIATLLLLRPGECPAFAELP